MNMKNILKDSSTVSNTAVKEMIDENNTDFYEQSQSNSDLIKIVDDVKTRLIQEEIQKHHVEYGNVKHPRWYSYLAAELVYLFVIGVGVYSFILSKNDTIPVVFGVMGGLSAFFGLFFMAITPPIIAESPKDKKRSIYKEIEKVRKQLLEKSLKVEIVSGADELNEKWSEVSVINGERAEKYLVRIVEDENTGFEQVDVKKFES